MLHRNSILVRCLDASIVCDRGDAYRVRVLVTGSLPTRRLALDQAACAAVEVQTQSTVAR